MNTDINANARISELETKLADALNRLSKNEGAVEQMNKSIASGNRMTNWQFVIFVFALVGSLLGSMYWATGVLEKRFDERFTQMEKRFEQMEKRFEDLKQVVLSQQKK